MRAFVGITDWDWFRLLRSTPDLEEVNFWQPGGSRVFRALQPGELFLFKLHSPRNFIVGGGLFVHATRLPISLAWEAFGIANGATNLQEMRTRLERYRKNGKDRFEDYTIGCILLQQPFFLAEEQWLPAPRDWRSEIVVGRKYDLSAEPGLALWRQLQDAAASPTQLRENPPQYGAPVLTFPRLGQGTFRVLVTDAYERRCAVTSERTLPALDAAHIKPYGDSGTHSVNNGLLLRRDVHALFDRGYLTVTPEHHLEISRRIREEFENGRDYYRLHGSQVRVPRRMQDRPSVDYLRWHNENVFRG